MAIILSDSHNSGGHMYGHKASSEHGEVEHTDRQGISFLDIGVVITHVMEIRSRYTLITFFFMSKERNGVSDVRRMFPSFSC